MYIVTGLISIAFGVVLSARPSIGAFTLALLFGLFSMIYGVSEIVAGVQMRRTGKTLHAVLQDAAGNQPGHGRRHFTRQAHP
jgi:hypothetical protein